MNNKKVGIMTYHGAYNYGSFLQAYALQKVIITRYHYDCKIINYRKPEQRAFYAIKKPYNSIRNIIKNIITFPYLEKINKRNNIFEKMIESELQKTEEFSSVDELSTINNYFDAYICGSDQIWNTNILDFDDSYLLSFVPNSIKIAYAASMGSLPSVSQTEKQVFCCALKDFKHISVRESAAKHLLENIISRDIKICVDPTFLLEQDAYNKLIKPEYLNQNLPNEQYIFFYSICYNEDMIRRVIEYAEHKHLPIYMVFTGSIRIAKYKNRINVIFDASVSDFLYLIKNAQIVCSSSFHGTALSIIYEKDFFVISEYKDGKFIYDERMNHLLKCLSLENRIAHEQINLDTNNIDYCKIKNKMENYIKESIKFLDTSIGNI